MWSGVCVESGTAGEVAAGETEMRRSGGKKKFTVVKIVYSQKIRRWLLFRVCVAR